MPYIPPPPRPPTPPRPFIPPAPPRIHQPNFHMQNQHRIQQQQQQQRFQQQQQRFHQQQIQQSQQRIHQQQQQNQQRLQQQLQMDHTRRQQALQQQQQHFQRQQEMFRRQQQDQQRLRQDQQRRDEDHRRQQQLLRNLHQTNTSSSASTGGVAGGDGSGVTVVNVSPGITMELSGLAGLLNGAIQLETSGQLQQDFQPSPQPAASAPPLSPQGAPSAPPTTAFEAPPPYQQYPQGGPPAGPPPSQAPPTSGPPAPAPSTGRPLSSSPPVVRPSVPAENRVVLKDGTQIIIQQEDEILFVGPTGVQMIVNCLPLYQPPEDALTAATETKQESKEEASSETTDDAAKVEASPKKKRTASSPSKLLRKAKSLTSIAITESELSDEERHTRSDDELLEDNPRSRKRKKSTSYGKHFSIKIHHQVSSPPPIDETDAVPPFTHTDKDIERPVQDNSDTCDTERLVKESATEGSQEISSEEVKTEPKAAPTEQTNPLVTVKEEPEANSDEVVRQKPTKEAVRKVNSTGSMPDFDDVSDPEDHKDGLQVNYLNTTSTLPRLKRSSGSVSFPQNPMTAVVHVAIESNPVVPEENEQVDGTVTNEEQQPATGPGEPGQNATPNDSQEVAEKTQQTAESKEDSTPTQEDNGGNEGEQLVPTATSNESTPSASTQETTTQSEASADHDTQQTTPTKSEASAETQQATPTKSEASPDSLPPKEGAALPTAPPPTSTPSPQARLTATLLPQSPVTMDGDYVERSGWLTKLSHRKGMFGDKWQKRYFVLHRSWLYYFKKYGDSNPKGVIRLLPTGWSKPIAQGTPRMADAVVSSNDKAGIMSVLRCLAVHRPNNFAASLSALLDEDGVAEAFRSQTVSVSSPQHSSRTFYMTASSNDERDAWVTAVNNNIQTYSHSAEALTTATKELKSMLRAVKSNAPPKDIPSLLLLLHTKTKKMRERAADT